ncbi:MAG: bifunctional phosphoribosylaminoimidazolecarboxamide formyltransferase/IMP cyclohydrolase [Anaerolineae bacterium]|nr:bifunctional phosphoribosylaminoimidazolecarboxamide formyltransferase/IMP cyclohydrolase [Anaerolineae bacterium]
MPRAFFSVYDKTGLVRFAESLAKLGWQLVAVQDTARALRETDLHVMDAATLTDTPAILGGRVTTLHPLVYAGILARDTAEDIAELKGYRVAPIDLVVCNLLPFRETIGRPGVTADEAMEQIDVGGVALLRAAARNFERVITLCDPSDYRRILSILRAGGVVDLETRRQLAAKAFAVTRDYDTAIHAYLLGMDDTEALPDAFSLVLWRIAHIQAANPHQAAALYAHVPDAGPLGGKTLAGPELTFTVAQDLDIGWSAVRNFEEPTVAIVRHGYLTGMATGETVSEALPRAVASDPTSATGGVIAINRTCDQAFVWSMGDLFIQAIAAPEFAPIAREDLIIRRRRCHLLRIESGPDAALRQMYSVRSGVLMQTPDVGDPPQAEWRPATQRKPTRPEEAALRFAWQVVRHVRSNAIVLATANATVGIGSAPNRLDALRLALYRAGDRARGAVLATDNFFEFPDGVEMAGEAGVTAVVQPGGALRDAAIIEAADRRKMAMIMTRARHIRS